MSEWHYVQMSVRTAAFMLLFSFLHILMPLRVKEPHSRSGCSRLRGFIRDKGEVVVLLKQFETQRAAGVMKRYRKREPERSQHLFQTI